MAAMLEAMLRSTVYMMPHTFILNIQKFCSPITSSRNGLSLLKLSQSCCFNYSTLKFVSAFSCFTKESLFRNVKT